MERYFTRIKETLKDLRELSFIEISKFHTGTRKIGLILNHINVHKISKK